MRRPPRPGPGRARPLLLLLLMAPLSQAPRPCAGPLGAAALRDVRAEVPEAAVRGRPVALRCRYDLENNTLYAVKWYKGGREFFRFAPRETPQLRVFDAPGVSVDTERSNATQVWLREADPALAGDFTCEVSEDAPSFQTYVDTAVMAVVELPTGQPSLEGVLPRYRPGDELLARCRSPPARPAPRLALLINSQAVSSEHLSEATPTTQADGRERSALQVKLRLQPHHFPGGRLRLRCVASLHDVYLQSSEKTAALAREKNGAGDGAALKPEWGPLPAPLPTLVLQRPGVSEPASGAAASLPPPPLPLLLPLLRLLMARVSG